MLPCTAGIYLFGTTIHRFAFVADGIMIVLQTMVKSIEVCDLPVRAARFVESKQWIVCGSDVSSILLPFFYYSFLGLANTRL